LVSPPWNHVGEHEDSQPTAIDSCASGHQPSIPSDVTIVFDFAYQFAIFSNLPRAAYLQQKAPSLADRTILFDFSLQTTVGANVSVIFELSDKFTTGSYFTIVLDLGNQSSVNPQVSCMNDRSQKQAEYRSHKLSH